MTTRRRSLGFPAVTAVLAMALGTASGCQRGSAPAPAPLQAAPTQENPHALGALPPVCEEYRRRLLLCIESDHFPANAKAGQRLALDQMLAIVREERRQQADAGRGATAAEANCRDSLATMQESGKTSCPGVF